MTSQIALVVEELAPGAKVTPTVQRMLQYLKGGVPLVWLIDNQDRCITVYRKGDSSQLFMEEEEVTASYVLPGLPIRVSEWLTPLGNESESVEQPGKHYSHLNDEGKRE